MVIYTTQAVDRPFIVKTINEKLAENHRVKRLQDYYRGEQDILQRFYDDPSKPNNRIPVNFCKEIADFLTAYLVGVPVTFTAPQIVLDLLNYNDNADTTQAVTLSMNVVGYGAELFYMDEDGIPRFSDLDPKECIFIFDNALTANLTHFIRLYPQDEEAKGYYVSVYDKDTQTDYTLTAAVGDLRLTGETPHFWQDVPVILYQNNRELQGSYEQLIPLQNALNKVVSDEVNDFESLVDAFLVLEGMKGTQPEDIANMKLNRVLLTDSENKAYWLTKDVNTDHVRNLKEDIINYIRELGKLPDIENVSGLSVSGEAIRMKLIKTEIQASKQERALTKGIQRKMELLYNILRLTAPSIGQYTDVTPVFQRNFLVDTSTTAGGDIV